MEFFFTHGLISHASFIDAYKNCNYAKYMTECDVNFTPSTDCVNSVKNTLANIPHTIDIYDVDADVCVTDGYSGMAEMLEYTAQWNPLSRYMYESLKNAEAKKLSMPLSNDAHALRYEQQNKVDPCLKRYMSPYLNRADVQKALHVETTKWNSSGNIKYSGKLSSMIPVWKDILNNPRSESWKILVFSGDFDSVVPFQSTQRWIHCLGLPVKQDWHPWKIGKQLGGNIIDYDRMSFLTIKGSGHMVGYYTPDKNFEFFRQWIENEI